ncbi:MAG TPA: tol-pal system protein YbgF [Rhizomicrobium sp.]|nr:tol-pal system protein YbgF [Rhizomicrobium sp.]
MIPRIAISILALGLIAMPVPASAQLFGPSDEEKAREAAQDSGIEDLQGAQQRQDARIRGLEDKVQGLTQSLSQATGQNEELGHQIQLQNEKLDRMEKDFAYRLCTLSAQQLGANDAINCTGGASAALPPRQTMRPGDALPPIGSEGAGEPAVRGRPPGILGSLPAAGPGAVPPPLSAGSAQYDQAMNLMSRAQYSEAQAAFRAYADANPDDSDLSPQALYWVGNISFIRQDYASAQRNFAEVIKKYPKSQRAPDAMLKLAQSFMSLGQKSEGCTTLGLIRTKYPNGSPQTLASAAALRKTACSK